MSSDVSICRSCVQKSDLLRGLLRDYEKDVEPPLSGGDTNTSVTMSLTLHCVTPIGDFVTIESWISLVSRVAIVVTICVCPVVHHRHCSLERFTKSKTNAG